MRNTRVHRHAPVCAQVLSLGDLRLHLLLTVGAQLLALSHPGLHLLLMAQALLLLRLLDPHRALIMGLLDAIGPNLLALGDASLGLLMAGTNLLARSHAGLCPLHPLRPCLLALGTHLLPLGTLRTLDRGKALLALNTRRGHGLTLLTLRSWRGNGLALLTLRFGCGTAATTTAMGRESGLATSAAAMRPCGCRGCDRQRGDARCEKYPGHDFISFERQKRSARDTVPTLKRMEPAFYRTSVNLKLLVRSES